MLVCRHGQNSKGHSRFRFRCRECRTVFQLIYTYQARQPGVKEKIVDMALNGAGVRDTARTLKVGTFGSRTDGAYRELLALLTPIQYRYDKPVMTGVVIAGKPRRVTM